MRHARRTILAWAASGRLDPATVAAAFRAAGATPDAAAWRRFLDRAALLAGVLACGAGVVFFFAWNWAAMGRWSKFALVELLLAAALAACWRLGLGRAAGVAALGGAMLMLGTLLALIGQTYQTGADTWELFAAWAALATPWVLVGCNGVLWLAWLALIELALVLQHQGFSGLLWLAVDDETRLLALLGAINSAALIAWEAGARARIAWLIERRTPRVLALAAGICWTWLVLWALLDASDRAGLVHLVYLGWMGLGYAYYRHVVRDLFMLAGGVLSAIVYVLSWLGTHLFDDASADTWLLFALLVIGLSAAAGTWLRKLAGEEST